MYWTKHIFLHAKDKKTMAFPESKIIKKTLCKIYPNLRNFARFFFEHPKDVESHNILECVWNVEWFYLCNLLKLRHKSRSSFCDPCSIRMILKLTQVLSNVTKVFSLKNPCGFIFLNKISLHFPGDILGRIL